MTTDLLKLAREALEDEKRGTPGPWERFIDSSTMSLFRVGQSRSWLVAQRVGGVDASFIAAARTREPLLAAEVIRLSEENAELGKCALQLFGMTSSQAMHQALASDIIANQQLVADEWTCPHGDAREPLNKHAKECPIRVFKMKRIAPEVALQRIAAALDSGEENEQLRAALAEACDLADEANGDPSSCSYNVLVGERIAELREGSTVADILTERDAAIAERDARDLEWQRRLVPLCDGQDGAGCESGDPLDCAIAALGVARHRLQDRIDEALASLAVQTERAEIAEPRIEKLASLYTECELALHEVVPEGADASHFKNAVAAVVAEVKRLSKENVRLANALVREGSWKAERDAALADAARLRGLLAECLTPLRGYEMEADFEESQSTASLIARIDAALSGGGKEAK